MKSAVNVNKILEDVNKLVKLNSLPDFRKVINLSMSYSQWRALVDYLYTNKAFHDKEELAKIEASRTFDYHGIEISIKEV